MPTYQDYQEQIAKLQALAKEAQQDELTKARDEIRGIMRTYNLTLEDIIENTPKSSTKKKGQVTPKFRHPETGATWSGRGRTPLWLKGQNVQDFLIK